MAGKYAGVIWRHYRSCLCEYDTLRDTLAALWGQTENPDSGWPEKVICPDGTEITDPSQWAGEALYYPSGEYRIDKDGNPQSENAALVEAQERSRDAFAARLGDAIALVEAAGYKVTKSGTNPIDLRLDSPWRVFPTLP